MRVLLAEDSGTMRTIIRRSLKSLGVTEIVEADNGFLAMTLFKAGEFDIVLTDWNMPEKTGIDVVRYIRESDKTVPVIMITTESEREKVQLAVQAGVSDYLIKPFTIAMLEQKFARFAINS
jgi:two-component system, chemotaxis family, chemotaxis protein CheY